MCQWTLRNTLNSSHMSGEHCSHSSPVRGFLTRAKKEYPFATRSIPTLPNVFLPRSPYILLRASVSPNILINNCLLLSTFLLWTFELFILPTIDFRGLRTALFDPPFHFLRIQISLLLKTILYFFWFRPDDISPTLKTLNIQNYLRYESFPTK